MVRMNNVWLLILFVIGTATFCCARVDDILVGNDYLGGKVWLRDRSDISQAVGEMEFGSEIRGLEYLSDGKMVIALAENNGTVQVRNSDFSLVASQSGFGAINALAIQSDDDIVIGVSDPNVDGTCYGTVFLTDANVAEKTRFVNFGGSVTALAVQSNDRILIGSDYLSGTVWVFDSDLAVGLGSQVNFTALANGHIQELAVLANDDIVVASDYPAQYGDPFSANIGKVWIRPSNNINGGVAEFANWGGEITALAVQSDDDIVLATDYQNGKVWLTPRNFNPAGMAGVPGHSNYVRDLAVQSDDDIVVISDYGNGTLWLYTPELAQITNFVNFGGLMRELAVAPQTYKQMDLNLDFYVNFEDFALAAQEWLVSYTSSDLRVLAEEWLQCTDPENANCD